MLTSKSRMSEGFMFLLSCPVVCVCVCVCVTKQAFLKATSKLEQYNDGSQIGPHEFKKKMH